MAADPVSLFALDLRELRRAAGGLTYRHMAQKTAYSPSVLSEAAAGRLVPTADVLEAFLKACGVDEADRAHWHGRWEAVRRSRPSVGASPELESAPGPGPRPPLRFYILGPLRVTCGETEVDIGPPTQRALLAAMLLDVGRVVPIERLIDMVWGDAGGTSRAVLHKRIGRLRQSLGLHGLVLETVARVGYRLEVVPEQVDVARFEQTVAQARNDRAAGDAEAAARLFRAALAEWSGDALADIDSRFFAGWRHRMAELWLEVAIESLQLDLDTGRHHIVVTEASRLAADHPYNERLCQLLMFALYRSGRSAEALEVFAQMRRRLDEEGLEPAPALDQLQMAILRHDPALAPEPAWTHVQDAASARPLPPQPEVAKDRVDPRDTGVSLGDVADQLAMTVRVQWTDEAARRRLNDPWALPVAWEPAAKAMFDEWDSLQLLANGGGAGWPTPPAPAGPQRRRGDWAGGPAELAGRGDELIDILARVPTGRLVVLGEPGSGKTVLLVRLVLDLLARREAGEQVPFLAPLAAWNPATQSLSEWLESRLVLDHPGLAAPAPGYGTANLAKALQDAGLILPVLDGLDEIPAAVRGRAIAAINDATRPGQRLVLTCRTLPYRQAVQPRQGIEVRPTGAAAIELRPLEAETVAIYLSAGGPATARRWAPVLTALTEDPTSAVARTLTTPLMAVLARTIYNPRPGEQAGDLADPADLLNLPTRNQIEGHLFDGYLPGAYRPHPNLTRCRWRPDDAQRWLAFLARHLEHNLNGAPDIAWWQVPHAVSRRIQRLAAGLTAGLITGLAAGLTAGLITGLAAGLSAGLAVGLLFGLTAGLAAGLTAGLAAEPDKPVRARQWRPRQPGLVLGLAAGLTAGLGGGLTAGLQGGLTAGLTFGLIAGVTFGLIAGLEPSPADLTTAADPRSLFMEDRAAFRTLALGAGLATGLAGGLAAEIGGRLVLGLGLGLAAVCGLAAGLQPAMWGQVQPIQRWLALRGRLPHQLMDFLADAHQRGVLRQVGAVYQFRYLELQRRLANRWTPTRR